jgi:hypothetical protein
MNNKRASRSQNISLSKSIRKALNQQSNTSTSQEDNGQENKGERGKSDIKWTDKGMFWATIVLTVGTLLIFWDATHQTEQTKKAVEAAIKADSISEKNYALANQSFESSNEESKQKSKRDSTGLNLQISALEEKERENTSYLQASDFQITVFEIGKQMVLTYNITNVGQQPAKMIEGEAHSVFARRKTINFNNVPAYTPLKDVYNMYVIKEAPTNLYFQVDTTLDARWKYGIESGIISIYLMGKIRYINLVTKKKRFYHFMAELRYIDRKLTYDMSYNENGDVKEEKQRNK